MNGSCLCGAVQYEVASLDGPIEHCSCITCRKAHSAAFNTAAGVKLKNFKWVSGEGLLSTYESSPGKRRRLCSICGSQLVAEYPGKPYVVLRVATLDEDPGKVAEFQIWKSQEAAWLVYDRDIPKYDEWEPGHA
ncbi:GFA family protein [Aurantivibrio infirmus]